MVQPPTQKTVKPTIKTPYGNTFYDHYGTKIDEGFPKGDIDHENLSKVKMLDDIEFTEFEAEIHDYVRGMLGHPIIRVELTAFQIKIAIDKAIATMSNHAASWFTQFATFQTTAGIGLYEIPPAILHNLTYVVYKKALLSIQSLAGTLEQDFFIRYFQENFIFQDFSVGEFYLLQQHLEMIRKVLGNEGSWDVIGQKYLQLMPSPNLTGNETVILEYRAINSDTVHPAYKIWIQDYALAICKKTLGLVRGKYKNIPGPGGGAQLDGPELREEGAKESEELLIQLRDEFEDPPAITAY